MEGAQGSDSCLILAAQPVQSSLLQMQQFIHIQGILLLRLLSKICSQVKVIKDFEENQSKIESLLHWVASVKKSRGVPEDKLWPVGKDGGRHGGGEVQDAPDGHWLEIVEKNLDLHYTSLKVGASIH